MKTMQYIGMGLMLLSFMGLIGIVCLAGLLISIASNNDGLTWAAVKEYLPSLVGLATFLVTVALLVYVVVFLMKQYGA